MLYVTSDIHGDYSRYKQLIEKLPLTETDTLVLLGDVVDRGAESMKILLDIMKHDNYLMFMGNHEQIALACLKILNQGMTKKTIENLGEDTVEMLTEWIYNLGGETTAAEFAKLSKDDQQAIMRFLEDLPLYAEVTANNQKYLLVHGGLEHFTPEKALNDYTDDELLWDRIDYGMKYFDDTVIVTGHTPTRYIAENPRPDFIYKNKNHIALDCGCGIERGHLGCICLDDMKEYYV